MAPAFWRVRKDIARLNDVRLHLARGAFGLLGMFCGSLNCPISAIFLGVEMFGGANIQYYAIAAAISFMLSANFGLYKEQKIVYSKIRAEFINRYTD